VCATPGFVPPPLRATPFHSLIGLDWGVSPISMLGGVHFLSRFYGEGQSLSSKVHMSKFSATCVLLAGVFARVLPGYQWDVTLKQPFCRRTWNARRASPASRVQMSSVGQNWDLPACPRASCLRTLWRRCLPPCLWRDAWPPAVPRLPPCPSLRFASCPRCASAQG
jgi:hypothetical protein